MSSSADKLIVGSAISIPVFLVLNIFISSIALKLLWGWYVSETFGIKEISYLQSAGLVILFRLLFVGVGERKRFNKEKFREKLQELKEKGESPEVIGKYVRKAIFAPFSDVIGRGILGPLSLLFLGWFVHLFI